MSAFLEGIGKVFGKIADQVQGRIERLKNEKIKLLEEKVKIMKGPASIESTRRVSVINKRLDEINAILTTNAKD